MIELILLLTCVAIIGGGVLYGRYVEKQFREHLSEFLKSMPSADIKAHARPRAASIISAKAAIRFEKSGKSRMQPGHVKKGRKLTNIPARHLTTS
ncbi:hypothetical protein [Tropicimonas sp.]|uniref:hypothetical protein n=1 Tax=Tropicimonas sp. TaxID=2067044 RepID=UPI003A89EFD2